MIAFFFSLNFSDIFRSTGWGQGARKRFDFQRSFMYKIDVLNCAFHLLYIKGNTFMMSTKTWQKCDSQALHPHASKIRKPTHLYCRCWRSTLWHYPLTRLKLKNVLSQLNFSALFFIKPDLRLYGMNVYQTKNQPILGHPFLYPLKRSDCFRGVQKSSICLKWNDKNRN